jgi:hypothetical protein
MSSRAAVAALLAFVLGASVSGCSDGYVDGNEPPGLVAVEPSRPGPERWARSHTGGRESGSRPAPAWRCSWSPTYDRNWHNDALCSNGGQVYRPHLLPYDSHITYGEMMAAAAAHERALNAGGGTSAELEGDTELDRFLEQQRPRKRDRFSELDRLLRQGEQGCYIFREDCE